MNTLVLCVAGISSLLHATSEQSSCQAVTMPIQAQFRPNSDTILANRASTIDDARAAMRFFRSSDKPCVPIWAMQGYLEKPSSSRKQGFYFAQLARGMWIPGGNDDSLVFKGASN